MNIDEEAISASVTAVLSASEHYGDDIIMLMKVLRMEARSLERSRGVKARNALYVWAQHYKFQSNILKEMQQTTLNHMLGRRLDELEFPWASRPRYPPQSPDPTEPKRKPHFMMLHWLGSPGEDYILVPLKTMVLGAGMTPGGLAVFGVTDPLQETSVFRKIHIYGNGESVEGGQYITSVEVNGVWCHLFDSCPWILPLHALPGQFNFLGEQIK